MKIVHTIVSEEVIVGIMATITIMMAVFWVTRETLRLRKSKATKTARSHDQWFATLTGVVISTIAVSGVVKHYFF